MLDTRNVEWLSRLQAHGPKLVSAVFAALILLQLLQLGYSLLAKPLKSPQPVVAPSEPHPQRSGVDIQTVVSAHLFGVAVADPAAQDPENAPQSSANLLLAGTIATQNPKRGVAIISDAGGPAKVYSVGERIGGASLHSVYLDHVILDRAGALETLPLPRQLPPSRAAATGRRIDCSGRASILPVPHRRCMAIERKVLSSTVLPTPRSPVSTMLRSGRPRAMRSRTTSNWAISWSRPASSGGRWPAPGA